MKLSQVPGRVVIHEGTKYLHFSGTSYLGMVQDDFFRSKLMEGLSTYGNNFGSSRNGNLQIDVYDEMEAELRKICGVPYVLCTSSGTLAARMLKDAMHSNYQMHFAPNTHPALHTGNSNSWSFNEWLQKLELHGRNNAICFNAIDPLHLVSQDLSLLKRFEEKDRILLVDDSHAIGVLGSEGQGISETLHSFDLKNYVIYGSLAKALGVDGGFIATDNKELFNKLRLAPLFAGASPMAPAFAFAFLESISHYQSKLVSLRSKLQYFEEHLKSRNQFNFFSTYPVFKCNYPNIQQVLLEKQILISSFSYPYPEDPVISRVIINDLHTKEDLDQLLTALEEIFS